MKPNFYKSVLIWSLIFTIYFAKYQISNIKIKILNGNIREYCTLNFESYCLYKGRRYNGKTMCGWRIKNCIVKYKQNVFLANLQSIFINIFFQPFSNFSEYLGIWHRLFCNFVSFVNFTYFTLFNNILMFIIK